MDLSVSPNALGAPSYKLSKSPSSETLKSPSDKRSEHDDALRKLTGVPSSSHVDASSITRGILPRQSHFPANQPPASQRPEPVSLASFIGGRATGPRLNRHAPQQDAHDPTQFEQRTISAPHPVFGKGGVAMPGMVTKPSTSVREAVRASEAVERYQPRLAKRTSTPSFAKQEEETQAPRPLSPQKSGYRDRTISTPSAAAARYIQQTQPRPISPQKSGNRERTLSTPGPTPVNNNFVSRPIFSRPNVEHRSPSPSKGDSSTPSRSTTPSMGVSRKPTTPRQAPLNASTPASPGKSSISTPSLARAVLPEPRSSPQMPIIPNNAAPSPAFQKPPPPKDITPSISRLQGRGFVQNMVRASTQLESSTRSTPSSPASRPSSGRKSTVLDRWQPNVAPPSPTPAPIPRQTSPVRKTYSELPMKSDPPPKPRTPVPVPAAPSPSPGKVLKPKTSHPHLHPDPLSPPEPLSPRRAKLAEKMLPPEDGIGFGSATTMVVYKPKTPEKSSSPVVEPSPPSAVDELGVRRDPSSDGKGKTRFSIPSEPPNPSGKPLNHPTKDRARKPKKNSNGMPSQAKLTHEPPKDHGPTHMNTLSLPRSSQKPRTPSPRLENSPSLPSPSFPSKPNTSKTMEWPSEKDSASRVAQITQKWGTSAPIGVKHVPSSSQSQAQAEIKPKPDSNLIRRALPGMANPDNLHASSTVSKPKSPSPESTLQAPSGSRNVGSNNVSPSGSSGYTGSVNSAEGQSKLSSSSQSDRPPRSPSSPKHTRIPSTGNRALVMDVAQALNDYNANAANGSTTTTREEVKSPVAESVPEPAAKTRVSPSLERRRSSYDRFSVVSVMPPLKEEATPHGTPVGTLKQTPDTLYKEASLQKSGPKTGEKERRSTVHFDFDDIPLPSFDVIKLLRSRQTPPLSSPDIKTISVDVLSINGTSSNTVSHDTNIFYDSELLAIVHRYKSKSSGLVSTNLWIWNGKKSIIGEKEERKVQEVAKRYNTSPTVVHQNSEPPPLVHLLGGSLIVRQGTRSHWSADNTAMYSVRNLAGVTFIDEHDLSVKNLCSAFSYCLKILDTVYIWHGCGSTDAERQAAVKYASQISYGEANAIQLYESENDQDELFWMALGDDDFAKADYWQWRRQASDVDPRIWRVNVMADPPIVAVTSLWQEPTREKSIYIIDCIWELFVKVGPAARGDRASIKLALNAAKCFSEMSASSRPFSPTVHVLVLPSKLPLDLRLNLRELGDAEVNNGEIPDHMNLLSLTQAESHLRQHAWERLALQDQTMLPLGVSASDAQ